MMTIEHIQEALKKLNQKEQMFFVQILNEHFNFDVRTCQMICHWEDSHNFDAALADNPDEYYKVYGNYDPVKKRK